MEPVMNFVTIVSQAWTNIPTLLLDITVKGLFLLLIASALVLSLRNASAATRHLVWCVAVCGLLVLPAVSFTLTATL